MSYLSKILAGSPSFDIEGVEIIERPIADFGKKGKGGSVGMHYLDEEGVYTKDSHELHSLVDEALKDNYPVIYLYNKVTPKTTPHMYLIKSETEIVSDHETGISAEKTMDSLMFHLMRKGSSDDKKKKALLSTVTNYADSRGLDAEYMLSFSKKLLDLSKSLYNSYASKEDVENTEEEKYEISAKKFLGSTARDVPFEDYATKGSPFMVMAKKFGKYDLNDYVYNAIKSKVSYKTMQKEISKAWKFHGKQTSTLHMIQASRLGNLLVMLYASHPDAPPESKDVALKEAQRYQIEAAIEGDRIPGGLGDDVPYSDVDQEELKLGISVELEHTSDKDLAAEIAKDHLIEDAHYYTKLKKFEKVI